MVTRDSVLFGYHLPTNLIPDSANPSNPDRPAVFTNDHPSPYDPIKSWVIQTSTFTQLQTFLQCGAMFLDDGPMQCGAIFDDGPMIA